MVFTDEREPQPASPSTAESVAVLPQTGTGNMGQHQAGQSTLQPTGVPGHQQVKFWRERVKDWYPDLQRQTYFLPSVYMNRTQHREEEVCGQKISVTQEPSSQCPDYSQGSGEPRPKRQRRGVLYESDAVDDEANRRVLSHLQKFQDTEVMFVVSQMQFGNYLNKPAYAAAASMLPKPGDLAQDKQRGDFDILIIHRHYGILACEIKAVGSKFSELLTTEQDKDDILVKKVKDAIKQMQKARDVLRYLVSKDERQPMIRTVLMLPNITRARLHRVLHNRQQILEDLSRCLCVSPSTDPSQAQLVSQLCLTADDLKNPGQWWQHWMSGAGTDPAMTDSVYLDLIARFCGPATTVQVHCQSVPRLALSSHSELRTLGEGVKETANRFAPVDIVLHPEQVDVLNESKPRVFISGPPGTGKSLLLLLKALDWLRAKKHVQIFSTGVESLAVSHMLLKQLELAADTAVRQTVHLHQFNLTNKEDRKQAVKTLKDSAQDDELYIIADEASRCFRDMCTELHHLVPNVHMWAASMFHDRQPREMSLVTLTKSLRTPLRITREVQKSGYMRQGLVDEYTDVRAPQPCDGPVPIIVRHAAAEEGHTECLTYDCVQCGKEVASKLKRDLNVGRTDSSNPPPLTYGDVFLLTQGDDLHETETDASGNTIQQVSGLLQGLREAGVPVSVLKSSDHRAVIEVTRMEQDHVVAANSLTVSGLERPVVVWVQGDEVTADESVGRQHGISRSTAQLVWVKRPL